MAMDRRDFLGLLGKIALGTAVGSPLSNISRAASLISPRTINTSDASYEISGGVIRQVTRSKKNKLGVLADIHAHTDNTRFFVSQLDKEGANIFIAPGDLSYSLRDPNGPENDYGEILSIGEPILSTGNLFLAIPGNHEQRITYAHALNHLSLKYSNMIDMERTPVADFEDFTIVALGGVGDARFCIPQGFVRSEKDFEEFYHLIKENQGSKPLIVCTHSPKQYSTKRGLDVSDRGNVNVGEKHLARVRAGLNSKFGISGHIHEAFGIINYKEEPVKAGEYSESLDLNPGAVWDHLKRPNLKPAAGIMEFNEDKARAYILNR